MTRHSVVARPRSHLPGRRPGPKKKPHSAAAVSGASLPWQALCVVSEPNWARSEWGASARA